MVQMAERTRRRKPTETPTHRIESATPSRLPVSSLAMRSPLVQPKLTVNQPGDKYEQEADAVAKAVMHTPAPLPQPDENRASVASVQRSAAPAEESIQRKWHPHSEDIVATRPEDNIQRQPAPEKDTLQRTETKEDRLQRKGEGTPRVSTSTAATIRNPGAGSPLPGSVRHRVEPRVGANLSGVRVHSDPSAHRAAASLNARAFTHRNHIFLNRTESTSNLGLIAHEATHVVQQGAASVQRQPLTDEKLPIQRQTTSEESVQRLPSIISRELNDYARHIPGYTLFTVVLGFNPLTGENVERNAINLLGGLMGLVPFGTFIFDKLQEHGILQSAFAWVLGELRRLDLSIARIERTLEAAWDDVRLAEGFDYNLAVVRRHFGRLYDDVVAFVRSLVDHIIGLIKEAVVGVAERLLANNRAWALIKKILHHDPLRDQPVQATTVEILEDFLRLIGKEQELEQMRERGTLVETAAWIDTQIGTFMSLLGELRGLFTEAWNAIQPENLPQLGTNLQNLANRAIGFLERVWTFATTVAAKVLELIKKALLNWLSSFARQTPGYPLLTVLLGKDPFMQEVVPRNATNLIRGFMSLIPGGEQKFQQMQETGVIPQAAQRIEAAMTTLGITWPFVQQLFIDIWNSFTIEDLIHPIDAFIRILQRFEEPLNRLFTFVIEVIKVVLELVLQLMNFPTDLIGSIITNALQALDDIQRDPVGFLLNLLSAVKLGFNKFLDNILTHLIGGLTNWLFGQLQSAGIQPPTDLSLESILNLVMQILGLTVDRLWEKLGERIGQENVARIRGAIDRLTGIWNFVKDVQERGIAAIWEYIESQISNLWNTVLEQVQNWVMTRVIERVTARLLSMLDPTGIMAVVNSFIAFFNAIQSAIEYFRPILEIINSFVSTVAEIARGSIEGAAQFLENTLARSLPVAIGFLANQVGLGNLGERIAEIIADIRGLIDRALNWLLDQAMNLGRAVLRSLGLGGDTPTGASSTSENANDVTKGTHFGREQHNLRVHMDEAGNISVLMASDGWGDFKQTIYQIRDRYVAQVIPERQNDFRQEMNRIASQSDEYKTLVERLPREQRIGAWQRNYLPDLDAEITNAAMDFGIGGVGAPHQFNANDHFVDKQRNERMVVTDPSVRQGTNLGLKGRPINKSNETFFSFSTYNTAWEAVNLTARPHMVSFGSYGGEITITQIPMPGGQVATLNPPGLNALSPSGAPYNERGHLIAQMFGGPNTTDNIVAQTSNANRSYSVGMSSIENRLRDDVNSTSDPINKPVYKYKVLISPPTFSAPPAQMTIYAERVYPTNINPPGIPKVKVIPNV